MTDTYYADDLIVLYHCDARETTLWTSADVMVTDPPYGMAYKSGWQDRTIAGDEDTSVRDTILEMWGDKPALVFGRWDCPHPAKAKMCLTWDKGDWPGMGDLALPWGPSTEEIYVIGSGFIGKRSGSIVSGNRLTGNTVHPNEKPVGLMHKLLEKCPQGVVSDPFAGSGSTLRAAKDAGRRAIGCEIDESHCETIAKRLAQGAFDLFANV